MKNIYLIATLGLCFNLIGCTVVDRERYQSPVISIPSTFKYESSKLNKLGIQPDFSDKWWTLFNDNLLNQIVDDVLSSNSDLIMAGMTLKQARIRAGLAKDKQNLRVNSNTNVGHTFDLNSGTNSSKGLSADFGVSYEVDLFGKLAHQTEVSEWEALATEQDLQATAQSLIADTIKYYLQLGYLNERYNVITKNLESSHQLFELVQTQYKVGKVSGLDLVQSEQAIQDQKANLIQIEQQIVETRSALALLLHKPIQQLAIVEPKDFYSITLPEIGAGIPSEILARRPDLKASEFRLRKIFASKQAIKASYYPSISLTGNLGSSSTSLIELVKNPTLVLSSSISFPFLQYNEMKKDLDISNLDYEKAIVKHRQEVYKALVDVENSLSECKQANSQIVFANQNLALANKVEEMTYIRYVNGAIALRDLLEVQTKANITRLSLVEAKKAEYNSYVNLLQAFGGSPITHINP